MPFLKEAAVGSVIIKALSMAFEGVKKADFILINTVEELESETLSVLNKYHPTYAIGPITFSPRTFPRIPSPGAYGPSRTATTGSTLSPPARSCTSRSGALLILVRK